MTQPERRTDPEAPEQQREGPVVRDKRRIDPQTGEVRRSGAPESASAHSGAQQASAAEGRAAAEPGDPRGAEPPAAAGEETEALRAQLAERTNDLQRLQAEFANYRKRVERDRVAVREQALAGVLGDLLPVLDDIERAGQHGELTGGFQKVAESFEDIVAKLGLTRFGEKGEAFDPTVHEALMHSYSDDVAEPSCVEILQPGYAVGGRVVRPARVAVAEPAPEAAPPAPEEVGAESDPQEAQPEGSTGTAAGTAAGTEAGTEADADAGRRDDGR